MRRLKKEKKRISLKLKIMLVLLVVISVGIISFFMSDTGKETIRMMNGVILKIKEKSHLDLEQVIVEGHARTQLKEINQALNLVQGMPVFDISLQEKKEAIEKLPWVKSVSVERYLPSVLFIKVMEKQPIAIWQNKGKYFPIDEEGQLILDKKTVVSNVLLVVGEDAPEHTPQLIEILSRYPKIDQKVRSAVRIGNRRWNLILNEVEDGIEVYLPEADIDSALSRLQSLDEESDILKRDLKVIDLRLPDRLIVQSPALTEGGRQKK